MRTREKETQLRAGLGEFAEDKSGDAPTSGMKEEGCGPLSGGWVHLEVERGVGVGTP